MEYEGDRVFFQIKSEESNKIYKLKLASHSTLRHLFAHVPVDAHLMRPQGDSSPIQPPRFTWHGITLDPNKTPRDYDMPGGEQNVQVIWLTYPSEPSGAAEDEEEMEDPYQPPPRGLQVPQFGPPQPTPLLRVPPTATEHHSHPSNLPATVTVNSTNNQLGPLDAQQRSAAATAAGIIQSPPRTMPQLNFPTPSPPKPEQTAASMYRQQPQVTYVDYMAELELVKSQAAVELASKEKQLVDAKRQAEQYRKSNDTLRTKLQAMELESLDADRKLRSTQGSTKAQADDIRELRHQLASLESTKSECANAIAAQKRAESIALRHSEEAQALRRFGEELTTELRKQEQRYEELKNELGDALGEMRSEVDMLNGEKKQLLQAVAEAKHRETILSTQFETLKRDYDHAKAELQNATASLAAMKAADQANAPGIKALHEKIAFMETEQPELRERAATAVVALESARADAQKWQRTAEDLQETVYRLRTEVQTAVSETHERCERVRRETEHMCEERFVAASKRALDASDREISDLRAAVTECNNAIVQAQAESRELRSQLLFLQRQQQQPPQPPPDNHRSASPSSEMVHSSRGVIQAPTSPSDSSRDYPLHSSVAARDSVPPPMRREFAAAASLPPPAGRQQYRSVENQNSVAALHAQPSLNPKPMFRRAPSAATEPSPSPVADRRLAMPAAGPMVSNGPPSAAGGLNHPSRPTTDARKLSEARIVPTLDPDDGDDNLPSAKVPGLQRGGAVKAK